MTIDEFPKCQKCNKGILVPLSDYGREGSSILYKAWVCTNPQCHFNIRIDNGDISIGGKVRDLLNPNPTT